MREKSIKKNAVMNCIKIVFQLIFPLISFPYASRVLMPDGIGKVNFANSITAYFVLLASLGISHYGLRTAAKLKKDSVLLSKFIQEMLVICSVSTICSYILFAISITQLDILKSYREVLLISSLSICFTTIGMEWLYSALEEYTYISIRSIIFQAISLILLFILVKNEDDYVQYAFITVFSSVGSNIFNFFHARKIICLNKNRRLEFSIHIKPIFVFFLYNVVCSLYMNLDTTMLGLLSGNQAVGLYTAALKVDRLSLSIVQALGAVLMPRLSYYLADNKIKEYNQLLVKGFNYTLLISFPICIGLISLSKEIVLLLSGALYLDAVPAMKIMAFIVPVIGISNIMALQIFVPLNKEIYGLLASSAAAVLNIVANMILIPVLKYNGAAIATILSEILALSICVCFSFKIVDYKNIFRYMWQYLFACLFIFPSVMIIKNFIEIHVMIIILSLGICPLIYGGILLMLKNPYVIEIFDSNKVFRKNQNK